LRFLCFHALLREALPTLIATPYLIPERTCNGETEGTRKGDSFFSSAVEKRRTMADDQFIAPSGAAGAAAPRLPRPTRVRNKQPADQQVSE